MQPLIRPEFRPKLWSAADLDAAARHWLGLSQLASVVDCRDEHRTELSLGGVPKADRDAVAAALAGRLPDAEVTTPYADTLAATGPVLDFETPPPAGLGVPSLAGPPFDGLYLEVRLTASAWKLNGKPRAAGTLVFAGELGPEGFTVYAVWGEGNSELAYQPGRETPWRHEEAWRADLEAFRHRGYSDATARSLAVTLFPLATLERVIGAFLWLAFLPDFDTRSPAAYLRRLAVNFALLTFALGVAWGLPSTGTVMTLLKVAVVLPFGVTTTILVVQFFAVWLMLWRRMSRLNAWVYSSPLRLVSGDGAAYLDNPFGRKSIADWEAVGCDFLGDAGYDNPDLHLVSRRFGVVQGGTTVVVLCAAVSEVRLDTTLRNRAWPARVVVELFTRFPNNGSAGTLAEDCVGSVRKLSGPECVLRVHVGLRDPAELLARHAELCREYAERTGAAPLKASNFAEVLGWYLERSEGERRLYGANPVTPTDALLVLMSYVRRAYR